MTRRVAVLSGGRSSEHEVSVDSARSVAEALAAAGWEVVTVEIDRAGAWSLAPGPAQPALGEGGGVGSTEPPGSGAAGFAGVGAGGGSELVRLPDRSVTGALAGVDVVFPVLHGPHGEDGTVQGLLELAGIPYVGAGVAASALCMDKDLLKAVLRDRGIPVPRNLTLRAGDEPRTPPYGYPVFVKPARLGSSVGISKAHDDTELAAAVSLAFEHDDKVLVEEFVDGTEVEVGVLGNRTPVASLPGEIVVKNRDWYDYDAKYVEGEMELVVPARISGEATERAQELAVEAFVAAECEGMARVDLFVRHDGVVLVNELNTIPGFTGTSVYAKLFEATGISYESLLDRLIDLALERHERRRELRY